MRRRKAPWLVIEQRQFRVFCKRCGEIEPGPRLPMPVDSFEKWGAYIIDRHADCKEPDVPYEVPEDWKVPGATGFTVSLTAG